MGHNRLSIFPYEDFFERLVIPHSFLRLANDFQSSLMKISLRVLYAVVGDKANEDFQSSLMKISLRA